MSAMVEQPLNQIEVSEITSDVKGKVNELITRSQEMFCKENPFIPKSIESINNIKLNAKLQGNFKSAKTNFALTGGQSAVSLEPKKENIYTITNGDNNKILLLTDSKIETLEGGLESNDAKISSALVVKSENTKEFEKTILSNALVSRKAPPKVPAPTWHAPWELSAVISGHLGWVRSIAFDPSNEWFATGSSDRTIKIWDTAKCCAGAEGGLKLTLTGHINCVRGLAVSSRSPYLFSAGEDKMVKCWDLEYNKVIRNYHGHLSACFSLALHPTLDILFTGGRDSVCRVWDIRTKEQIHVLGGHQGAVSTIVSNAVDPQVITGSHDSTIKLWDLVAGKSMTTLTQHKKSVRNICVNPREFSFVSATADNIKKWQARDGKFLQNLTGHNSVVNSLSMNEDGVLASCGDNGSLNFWDYDTGHCFQSTETVVQPGSLDAEAGIFASSFDMSGSRLVTCEADKSIKIWKENDQASPESHPIDMKAWSKKCLSQKRY